MKLIRTRLAKNASCNIGNIYANQKAKGSSALYKVGTIYWLILVISGSDLFIENKNKQLFFSRRK